MNLRHHAPLIIGTLALVIALGAVEWRQANPSWAKYQPGGQVRTLVPTISNKPELCLTCHYGIEEISASHPVDVFGCVSCHGGDPLSLEEKRAHDGLLGPRGNPADLSVVEQSCGTSDCHGGELATNRNQIVRVQHSLQATYTGAISAVLQANGLDGPPYGIIAAQAINYDVPNTVTALSAFDPANFNHAAVTAFAEKCLNCHLSAQSIAQPDFYRGTGCAACHVPYNKEGLYEGSDPTIKRDEAGHAATHKLTILMPTSQCAHCHGRGEYSTSNITFTQHDPAASFKPHRADTSVLCERELDCIDCHNAAEAMGDGNLYPSVAAAPLVECRTCHGTLTDLPPLVTLTDPNDPAFRRDKLNDNYALREGDTVVLAPNGEALGAVRWEDNRLVLTSRVTGTTYLVPLVKGSACKQNVEQQDAESCRECHGQP